MTEYIIADPTGNITVLVKGIASAETKSEIVHNIFEIEPTCEQVGFIASEGTGEIALEMMGGEFCGNATLSAAAYQAYAEDLNVDESVTVTVHSSGIEHPVDVRIGRRANVETTSGGENPAYVGTLEMKMPTLTTFGEYPMVQLEGISHMLVPSECMTDDAAEVFVKKVAEETGVLAQGIILYKNSDDDPDSVIIRPLVYVRGSDTLVWEHGCASGSVAMGYYRFMKDENNDTTAVRQPGGTILIEIDEDRVLMTGQVILKV